MGTHPIFESDFDCLTDLECCLAAFCVSQPLGSFPPVWLTLISIFRILLTTEQSLFQPPRMISSMLSLSKKSFVKLISTPSTPPWLRQPSERLRRRGLGRIRSGPSSYLFLGPIRGY